MRRLTEAQRDALYLVCRDGGRPVFSDGPTVAALARRGLVINCGNFWRPTPEGLRHNLTANAERIRRFGIGKGQ